MKPGIILSMHIVLPGCLMQPGIFWYGQVASGKICGMIKSESKNMEPEADLK